MDWCNQISCYQAGVEAKFFVPARHNGEIIFFIPIDSWLGIDSQPGEFSAQIQNTSGEHGMPVDVLALIGLPVFKQTIEYETYSKDYYWYRSGDGLITYAGQRFSNEWGDNEIKSEPQLDFGAGKISEKILGVSGYDKYALPYREPSATLLDLWFRDNFFTGYFHSSLVMDSYGATEANVEDDLLNFHKTNAPHAALTEIKAWLKSKSSEVAEPLNITLNLKVIDESTQLPVSGAEVYFDIGSSCTVVPNYTDAAGMLSVELPFYPTTQYKALVRANGYRSGEFDTGYTTDLTPALSRPEFGTIALQSTSAAIPTVTSATGRVWMDRNLGALMPATSMTNPLSYGDLYQWGRGKDGHEKRTSGTTATLSSSDNPGHGNFITATSEPQDWRTPQNDNLWQGAAGMNNPCPSGFRLPTAAEWQAEINSWSSQNAAGAFASPLKLVMAGIRSSDGTVYGGGNFGMYWSGTAMMDNAFRVDSTSSNMTAYSRANGLGVRCIKDDGGMNEGLVAYYKFDGNANDSSMNGHNGIVHGRNSYAAGISGQAISLDGIGDSVELDENMSTDYFSISAWFKTSSDRTGDGNVLTLIRLRYYGYVIAINCCPSAGSLYFANYIPNSSCYNITEGSYNDNEWHHVVMSYGKESGFDVYIDGKIIYSFNNNINDPVYHASGGGYYIGKDGNADINLFQGEIDEFRIYNRPLLKSEVEHLYNLR